jgi:hypothetical protein
MRWQWQGWWSCSGLAEIGGGEVEGVGGILAVGWRWWLSGGRVLVVVAVDWQWPWHTN